MMILTMRLFRLLLGLVFLTWLLSGTSAALAQCGIPGQYLAADGTCKCPEGTYHDRGTVACEQTTCPPEAGRTYTMECSCPAGTVGQVGNYTTETGHPYTLVEACVAPGSGDTAQGGGLGGVLDTILPSSLILPASQRIRDGYDSMVNGSGLERLAGAASLVGVAAEAGLVVVSVVGAVRGVSGVLAARAAARAAGAAVTQTAGRLVARIGSAELPQIVGQTRPLLQTLLRQMKAAGMKATRENLLAVMNQARAAAGLPPWGMSSLEIVLKGIGLVLK
jgi:hypothetical protein